MKREAHVLPFFRLLCTVIRNVGSFPPFTPHQKQQALQWASQAFPYCVYLNPNEIPFPQEGFLHVLAAGSTALTWQSDKGLDELQQAVNAQPDWYFGYIAYDYKNQLEDVRSRHMADIDFGDLFFFRPEVLLFFKEDSTEIHTTGSPQSVFEELGRVKTISQAPSVEPLQAKETQTDYLRKVEALRQHIIEGDIYEINYCQAFTAQVHSLNPTSTYWKLNQIAPAPFSCFVKNIDRFLLSASPERFIKKMGNRIVSQPIKGTSKRANNPEEDLIRKESLLHSEKERAENMMIVDLVRNDLARTAEVGSVKVEELFGLYSFSHVHQMISTVTSELKLGIEGLEALKMAFPMGSMTGAPKIRAMELIDHYESFRRGIFSGTVGYISPEGDFDFNVVIRSMMYDSGQSLLSFAAGSAITYDSDPHSEWEESLLKTQHILQVLG